MGALDLNQAEFLFESEALGRGAVQVLGFSGHEEIARPFLFTIDLVSARADLPLESPIGEPACLELRGRLLGTGQRYSRFVHGIIERFELVRIGARHHQYQATLVPTLLPLFHTQRSRIFQKMSTPDIIQAVLKAQVPAEWIEPMLHAQYGERDYCVQYQESDLDFVSRLLESDGIFYFFDHDSDKDVTVLGDGKHAHVALPHFGELRHYDHPHLYEEGLYEFRAAATMRPGAVALRDFRFKQPGLDMEAKKDSQDRFSRLEKYHYPGRYVDPGMGTRLAQVRLQEQQHDRFKFLSQSNCRDLRPGYTFQLRGHGRRELNDESEGYLILSVEHQGTQPQALGEDHSDKSQKPSYEARLICIPAKVPFRPQRLTPRPSVLGIQTAVVVGPPGEEIHCDDHGRVKIQFHWDREGQRDDNSSCWVRVSQPWGGSGQGGMFIPRIGQEVVVQFLEGDPDRPLIVGRVYNGENPVPHALPATKNISTIRSCSTPGGGGFNEIKFDDTAGNELVFCHAQKDQHEIVGNDHHVHVKNDQKEQIDNNRQAKVAKNEKLHVGVDQSLLVGANQQNHIGTDQSSNIGSNQSTVVGVDQSHTIGANQNVAIGNNQSHMIGANQSTLIGMDQSHTIGANQSINVGADHLLDVGGNQATTIAGNQLNSIIGERVLNVATNDTETVLLNKALTVGIAYEIQVGGAMNTTVGGAMKTTVIGNLIQSIGTGAKFTMTPKSISLDADAAADKSATIDMDDKGIKLDMNATATITISDKQIEFAVGENKIQLTEDGITINGKKVDVIGKPINLNC